MTRQSTWFYVHERELNQPCESSILRLGQATARPLVSVRSSIFCSDMNTIKCPSCTQSTEDTYLTAVLRMQALQLVKSVYAILTKQF